jgi:hypothetical protein
MRTLLGEQFAPITSSPRFLRLGLDEVVRALTDGRRSIVPGSADAREIPDGFPDCLSRLEPLTTSRRPRELLVAMRGEWTAYFDCGLHGTDAVAPVGYLARADGCDGLAIRSRPSTASLPGVKDGRLGGVQFELFGPTRTEFLNYVRTVSLIFDSHWEFDVGGTPQSFEETEAYHARRVRDRFNSQMLERYCQALGVDVFNPDAYGPGAVLVTSRLVGEPRGPVLSLAEAQVYLGIVPGEADRFPG